MRLQDFYDKLQIKGGGAAEALMRSDLEDALATIALEVGGPRVVVTVAADGEVDLGEWRSGVPVVGRRFLTVPGAQARANPDLAVVLLDGALAVAGLCVVDGVARTPVVLTVECEPPPVPEDAASEEGRAYEVPFGDCALNYLLSERLAESQPMSARLYYARYQQGLLREKRRFRDAADVGGIRPLPDVSVVP